MAGLAKVTSDDSTVASMNMSEILVALFVFAGCAVLLLGWTLERPVGRGRPARVRTNEYRSDRRHTQ
jgi:hypothetical protein